jgi:hypothetical protein
VGQHAGADTGGDRGGAERWLTVDAVTVQGRRPPHTSSRRRVNARQCVTGQWVCSVPKPVASAYACSWAAPVTTNKDFRSKKRAPRWPFAEKGNDRTARALARAAECRRRADRAVVRDVRRSIFARVKFLSRLLTALNLLPSTATLAFVSRPSSRQRATNRAHTLRIAGPCRGWSSRTPGIRGTSSAARNSGPPAGYRRRRSTRQA